jgi:hypothetical protein
MLKAGDRVKVKLDAYYYQGCTGVIQHIGKFTNGKDCVMVNIDNIDYHPKSFEANELEKI